MKIINWNHNILLKFSKIIEDSVLTQQVYLQKKLNEQREEIIHIAF